MQLLPGILGGTSFVPKYLSTIWFSPEMSPEISSYSLKTEMYILNHIDPNLKPTIYEPPFSFL